MRDSVSHLTGADDADFIDLHDDKCLNSKDAGAYNATQTSARGFRTCSNNTFADGALPICGDEGLFEGLPADKE
jgi:hypothetical protein